MSQLKAVYTKEFLSAFANQVATYQSSFNTNSFVEDILAGTWDDLSLRERMKKIATTLEY